MLFVLIVGTLYFSIYFSFKNIIFKYGFDVRIIFKDFFEQYAVVFIITTPFLIYLFYELFKKKDSKVIAEIFTILFALSTFFYPFYNQKIEEINSNINKFNNPRYNKSSDNIEDKEKIIKLLNKYRYYYNFFSPNNSQSYDWFMEEKVFNFSGIYLEVNFGDEELYMPISRFRGNFSNSQLHRFNFQFRNLGGSNFKNSKLGCVDFSVSHLEGVNFSGANFYCYDFNKKYYLDFHDSYIAKANFIGLKISNENFLTYLKNYRNRRWKINFTNVKNIELSCFDKGAKEELIKIFKLKVDEKQLKEYEFNVCKKTRGVKK